MQHENQKTLGTRTRSVAALLLVLVLIAHPALADPAPATAVDEQATTVRALLLPDAETRLASMQTGRVIAVNASLGATFAKEELLVELDCQDRRAQLRVVLAQIPGAREQSQALRRLQALGQAGEVDVTVAISEYSRLQELAQQLLGAVEDCFIRAPWAGRVSAVYVREFSTVAPGEPLLELVRSGPLRVQMNLPSQLGPSLRAGMPFTLTVDETGTRHAGRLEQINARIDPVSRSIEVQGRLDTIDERLLPGMSGQVQLRKRP